MSARPCSKFCKYPWILDFHEIDRWIILQYAGGSKAILIRSITFYIFFFFFVIKWNDTLGFTTSKVQDKRINSISGRKITQITKFELPSLYSKAGIDCFSILSYSANFENLVYFTSLFLK